ncbi:MAG TPA: hypothetical protein VGG33_26805 [Polyangia bacterium]
MQLKPKTAVACVLAFLLAFAAVTSAARAAEATDAPRDCAARLAFIDQRLQHTAHRSRVWSWGWGLGLTGLTVGNLTMVPLVERDNRVDYYVGAGTSFVGILPLLILPLSAMGDARALATKRTSGTACNALLPEAETMLARSAQTQAEGRAWWNHLANVVLNGGAGLFLGLAYDHWTSGIITGLGGIAIGEAMILTQPVDSPADLAQYQRQGDERRVTLTPMIAPQRFGLALAVGF